MLHSESVKFVTFSSDGKLIISAAGNTVRVWDVAAKVCIQKLLGHNDPVLSASYSSDGSHIISASKSGIKIWDIPPLQELIDETRERFKDRQLTPEERKKFYLE
jgi:WD40 repeat protein